MTRPPARAAGPGHGDDLQEAPPRPCAAAGRGPEHLVKDHKIGPRPSVQEAGIGLHRIARAQRTENGLPPDSRAIAAAWVMPAGLVQAAQQGQGHGPRCPRAPASPEPAPGGPRWGLPLRGR